MPKPAPTPPPSPQPPKPRRAREAGSVPVRLPTVLLTEEEADALCCARTGFVPDEFFDRRGVAKDARAYVLQAVANSVAVLIQPAVEKLRAKRHEGELAAARAEAEAAAAKVRELESRAKPAMPAGEVEHPVGA